MCWWFIIKTTPYSYLSIKIKINYSNFNSKIAVWLIIWKVNEEDIEFTLIYSEFCPWWYLLQIFQLYILFSCSGYLLLWPDQFFCHALQSVCSENPIYSDGFSYFFFLLFGDDFYYNSYQFWIMSHCMCLNIMFCDSVNSGET